MIEWPEGEKRPTKYWLSTVPEDTVLRDLRGLEAEVAFFAGVLEYVSDLRFVIRWLSTQVDSCVLSYECVRAGGGRVRRWLAALGRAKFGYLSHYTEDELVTLFTTHGFALKKQDVWTSQRLFLFVRASGDRQGAR